MTQPGAAEAGPALALAAGPGGGRVRNGERGRERLGDITELSPAVRGLRVSDAIM